MSARVDQFCDKLRDRLNTMEGRLQTVKATVQGMSKEAEKTLREKLAETRTRVETQKEKVEKTRANLKARAQEKIGQAREAISEWKAKHETRKLQARADRAEAYAADAVYHAVASIDEAEEAILEAVIARMDADGAE